MDPLSDAVTCDSHGGVGPPPPAASATPPPAITLRPAAVTAVAAPTTSDRSFPFMRTPFRRVMAIAARLQASRTPFRPDHSGPAGPPPGRAGATPCDPRRRPQRAHNSIKPIDLIEYARVSSFRVSWLWAR